MYLYFCLRLDNKVCNAKLSTTTLSAQSNWSQDDAGGSSGLCQVPRTVPRGGGDKKTSCHGQDDLHKEGLDFQRTACIERPF